MALKKREFTPESGTVDTYGKVTFIFIRKEFSFLSANGRPSISAAGYLLATVGQLAEIRLNVSDPDGDKVTVSLDTVLPDGATFNSTYNVFQWTPTNTNPVNIS